MAAAAAEEEEEEEEEEMATSSQKAKDTAGKNKTRNFSPRALSDSPPVLGLAN